VLPEDTATRLRAAIPANPTVTVPIPVTFLPEL
jgi:hypothetical protein